MFYPHYKTVSIERLHTEFEKENVCTFYRVTKQAVASTSERFIEFGRSLGYN